MGVLTAVESTSWQEVALALINAAQLVMLTIIGSRQQQLHNRINGGIDEWLLRRERRAKQQLPPPPPIGGDDGR